MVKVLYVLGLVFVYLGVVLLESLGVIVDVFEVVFSDEIVDFKIGVLGMFRDDWFKMLLGVFCVFVVKVFMFYVIEILICGMFYIIFEYFMSDCIVEYKCDNGICIGVIIGIGVCVNFYFDIRMN